MENTFLIVGLGNPGDKYTRTRHNIGFKAIEELQQVEGHSFSNWKLSKNFSAEISEGKYNDNKLILIKPQTFMNLSGKSVAVVAGFYKINSKNIIIIHDDKDIEVGLFRIRDMGSSGGHNGINSIAQHLGTLDFMRFKIGIKNTQIEFMDTANFVLSNFNNDENEIIKTIIKERVVPAVFETIDEGIKSAQNKYNG